MRFLAVILLAPWLLILGWAYWAYPKSLPRIPARRAFDLLALLAAFAVAIGLAAYAFDGSAAVAHSAYGRASGAIWQQVMPVLYGYGGFLTVLALALAVRALLWGRRRA